MAVLTCDTVIGDTARFSNSSMSSPDNGTSIGIFDRGRIMIHPAQCLEAPLHNPQTLLGEHAIVGRAVMRLGIGETQTQMKGLLQEIQPISGRSNITSSTSLFTS